MLGAGGGGGGRVSAWTRYEVAMLCLFSVELWKVRDSGTH